MTLWKSPYRNLFPSRRRLIEQGFGSLIAPFDFDLGSLTFTPSMAKRAGGTFAAAPIVQGDANNLSGLTDDVLTYPRGNRIFDEFYANEDAYQGTVSLWWTPEFSSADLSGTGDHYIWRPSSIASYLIRYEYDSNRFAIGLGDRFIFVSMAITAGTTYHIVARWDSKKTLDGTNYICFSVNDSHTFGATAALTPATNLTECYIGNDQGFNEASSGIIENLKADRRVWYEATSGTGEPYYFDANGYIDEIAGVYAGGAGMDPALIQASWDCCLDVPTDSAVGALATGNGEAWSHPHASALLNNTWLEDTFGPNQQDCVVSNGSTTSVVVSDGVVIQDLPDAEFTFEAWIRDDNIYSEFNRIATKGDHFQVQIDATGKLTITIDCATTDAVSNISSSLLEGDGKWHHIVAYFDDAGDRKPYLAIDGKWVTIYQVAGVGAYVSDIGDDLYLLNRSAGDRCVDGAMGWVRISDNDRYTHGTDFIPPRNKPASDGNTVVLYHFDEGTGATLDNETGAAAYDGTITDGAWTEKWEYTGTPLELTSFEQAYNSSAISAGSAASIDDVPAAGGAFTVEGWFRIDGSISAFPTLFEKNTQWDTNGWYLTGRTADFGVGCRVNLATGDAQASVMLGGFSPNLADGRWHHCAMTYDDTTKRAQCFLDGVAGTLGAAGTGAYQSDAAANFLIGSSVNVGSNAHFDGGIGWCRYSDNIRYTDNFLPSTRVNPPADDGNTVSLWLFDEGAGTTAADTNANANDATITMGAGQWRNTFAQEYDSPGSRTYAWGYSIGSDAPSDGVEQHIAVTAGDDWVLRIPVRYEDATAWAQILVYDETGAAAISTFNGPPLTGLHDGGDDAAAMTDTGNVFPASLIDGEIYNITDGSSGTITAVGGTNQDTITATLAGGTGDDWDDNDVYMIVPPANWVWCEPFCVEMPAGCTEASVQLLNAAGDGVLLWQQAEVQTNLVTGDPSIEDNNASNPFIPTGWANVLLDAGDTEFEAAIVHSGAGGAEWNVGAIWGEYMELQITLADNKFFSYGLQHRGDGTDALRLITSDAALHYSLADNSHTPDTGAVWLLSNDVRRATGANPTLIINPSDGAPSGDRFHDDVFVVALDDVSLTATPASEANSLEGTGIRIDGRDAATQTQTASGVALDVILQATQGWIRWRWTPRHDAAQLDGFSEVATENRIMRVIFDATHWLEVRITAASAIRLGFNDGGGNHFNTWNCAGQVVAGASYLMEVKYTPAVMNLYQDGVIRATITTPIDFGASVPSTAWWGSVGGTYQGDGVFSAP